MIFKFFRKPISSKIDFYKLNHEREKRKLIKAKVKIEEFFKSYFFDDEEYKLFLLTILNSFRDITYFHNIPHNSAFYKLCNIYSDIVWVLENSELISFFQKESSIIYFAIHNVKFKEIDNLIVIASSIN